MYAAKSLRGLVASGALPRFDMHRIQQRAVYASGIFRYVRFISCRLAQVIRIAPKPIAKQRLGITVQALKVVFRHC